MGFIDFGIEMEYELEKVVEKLGAGKKLVTTQQFKNADKGPPYIAVGNGRSTKDCPVNVVMDAFQVFSELSPAQRQLFIDLKDVLVEERMAGHYSTRHHENPNLIWLDDHDSNEFHQSIRTRMGQNRNGTTLEEKGVLKKIKVGKYMFNPYLFPPPDDFKRIAEIWEELSVK